MGAGSAPDVVGQARVQERAERNAWNREAFANRPTQNTPFGTIDWNTTMIDPNTGEEVVKTSYGRWVPVSTLVSNPNNTATPAKSWYESTYTLDPGSRINPVHKWEQTTTLNPEWQKTLDNTRGMIDAQTGFRTQTANNWAANPVDFGQYGGSNLSPTIGTNDWREFGTASPNIGAQDWRQFGYSSPTTSADGWREFGTSDPTIGAGDWRQFGTTEQTIGAGDWRQFGTSDPTIGADDWREFGTPERTIDSGTFDSRFGQAGDHEYGDHSMEGGDWSYINYQPDAIRRQAEQQTLDFMYAQLDPQWEGRTADLEIQLRNQGLRPGDAAYDRAMESNSRQRNIAYENARNQALADSRAEAAMLWDQEMAASNQKNFLHQSDIDNIYRARQSNIENYMSGRRDDMDAYLAYQQAAFGQDFATRDLQLRNNLLYGQTAFDQDFQSRQQQLDANLAYGREAWQQDYGGRQQQLDANLRYGSEAFRQDFDSRQQQLDANRLYEQQAWQQDFYGRQQALDANRYYSQLAYDQDRMARQDAIAAQLNYGNAAYNQQLQAQQLGLDAATRQEQLMQGRYGLTDPTPALNTVSGMI